jgi:hypothetical protein
MSYQFAARFKNVEATNLWQTIVSTLHSGTVIHSIKKVPYTIQQVNSSEISFTADTRSDGNAEIITRTEFDQVVLDLKALGRFNTSTSKPAFLKTKLYKKRSPFFAMLLFINAIERI